MFNNKFLKGKGEVNFWSGASIHFCSANTPIGAEVIDHGVGRESQLSSVELVQAALANTENISSSYSRLSSTVE